MVKKIFFNTVVVKLGIQRWPYHAQRNNSTKEKSPFIEFKIKESHEIAHEIAFQLETPKKETNPKIKKKTSSKGDIDFILGQRTEEFLPSYQQLLHQINSNNSEKNNEKNM